MPQFPSLQSPIPISIKGIIFLVGMPGAGKTYWGAQLANALNRRFIDLDNYISIQEKASISALFASYGEKGFREREQKYLASVISGADSPLVVACGGGTPCFFNNMELMKKNGVVVYLDVPIEELVDRLDKSTEERPLLKGRGVMETYLIKMMNERSAFYEQAHHKLDKELISITNFGKILTDA